MVYYLGEMFGKNLGTTHDPNILSKNVAHAEAPYFQNERINIFDEPVV